MSSFDLSSTGLNHDAAREFAHALFGHELIAGMFIGSSQFPPERGRHGWCSDPEGAAAWAMTAATEGNVYFRMTPVREKPVRGRGKAGIAAAIVGTHGDIDIAGPAHRKTKLPTTIDDARRILDLIGIKPTLLVHSGHGLQPHYLLTEPYIFEGETDLARAALVAKRFDLTVAAAARSLGFESDAVGDLARILRVPGSVNHKLEPVAVTILERGGPRYTLEQIEQVLIDPVMSATAAQSKSGAGSQADQTIGFPGADSELLNRARKSKNGSSFSALFDRGDTAAFGADQSDADWHLVTKLAFWCGPNAKRIDCLFRQSKLMRDKWDETHSADGRTYGEITISKVLASQKTFYCPRPALPIVVVSNRQLRDQSRDALAALEALNSPPQLFQRGTEIVRVRKDEVDGQWVIQSVSVDQMIGMLTRCADFVRMTEDGAVAVAPPQQIARDILALPAWRFPVLEGVVGYPRIRPDGTVLSKPGYDPITRLYLSEYEGHEEFSVPEDPSDDEVADARSRMFTMLADFPFVDQASRANCVGLMLTPVVRSAIDGHTPVAAVDALSKQGTGKGLLTIVSLVASTGRIPTMTAIPNNEDEWRKSLTAILQTGAEVVVFDNSTLSFIESGVWANAITADIFDDRLLGVSKRAKSRVRCTWVITGNAMVFGGDMARRVYSILLDAKCERPEDRSGFKLELPKWALENKLDLVRACLVLCRRWWSDGCPTPRVTPLGSFEEWTRIVGGILQNAGIPGFLDNRISFREAADADRAEWTGFIAAVADAVPTGQIFNTAMLVDAMKQENALTNALPAYLAEIREKKASFSAKLGRALQKRAGAVTGRYRLESAGRDTHTKRALYRIVRAEEVAAGAVVCGGCDDPPENRTEFIPL